MLALVILPMATVLLPFFGVVLPLVDRRHRHRIARRYDRLRRSALRGESSSAEDVEAEIRYLRTLRRQVIEETDVAPLYFGEIFHLTMHIDLVLERLERRREALVDVKEGAYRGLPAR